ncbi:MAG: hypothetical protein D6722_16505 [Bacteroidetes bacterium]|nr:MAG: hypothetical protein D6722_16505 [Bacteroidota bacterium]
MGLVVLIVVLILGVVLFLNFAPAFGDSPSGESLARIQASPNYDGEKFVNQVETRLDTRDPESGQSLFTSVFRMLSPPPGKTPAVPLPSEAFSPADLQEGTFVWLGHSTVLMRTGGLVILTDPVFHQASPLPGTVEPFAMVHTPRMEDLPAQIDIVLISHDHYDHLDYQAIQELTPRVGHFLVPLGVKAHLLRWGVPGDQIEEHDWHDSLTYGATRLTMTPARHFSGRGLTNNFSTLWCSWVIQSDSLRIFFNGDSGYWGGFREIGDAYGPFDIAFVENGAYDKDWAEIHMMPEESVQASLDLQAERMFPIHWGKFDLANHPWDDPILRTERESARRQVQIVTPLIGQPFTLENAPHLTWWEGVRAQMEAGE